MRRLAVALAGWLLEWAGPKARVLPDPLDVWFDWRFLYHYRKQPTEMDWVRLWATFKRPK